MKTLVRIQESKDTKLGLGFMTIQILVHPYKDSDTTEVIGHFSFQRNLSEEDSRWYALRYNLSTDNVDHMKKMTKIAMHIKANTTYDAQPDEILKAIGAVEYKVFNSEFYPASYEGYLLFDVVTTAGTSRGSVYSRIAAPSPTAAQKILKKRNWGDNFELKDASSVINF